MDARLEAIEETLYRVTQLLTRAGLGNQERLPNNPIDDHEDRTVRIDIHEFDGQSTKPEVYIEWEASLDRYFEYKNTTPERQYKLAKIKLTKLAAVWLEGIQRQRRREDRNRIDTWNKLKKHLRRKYVPNNYKHQLYIQWSTLNQVGKECE